jgi:hypothetical protein
MLGSVAIRTACTCHTMKATHTASKALAAALLFGGLSLVTAGSPVANADIDFECEPGCWGAIAASLSNGQEEIRMNYRTRQNAEDAAVLWCDVLGETNDCEVITSGLGCLSIAESSDGIAFAGRMLLPKTRPTQQRWMGRGLGPRSTSTTATTGCSRHFDPLPPRASRHRGPATRRNSRVFASARRRV